ncbi:hypothetical protein AWH56_011370 [Anaerobacillus isosaccharinicus]|uniref:Uncharacterized protein n=1 Tax=Anaerobacillus isosaccharinicus TaxID=1532552 RepID=A0A1S2M9B1_9BACI|nr:hypothetical protein [Anaerobacillus isosaccharinicus]MBA5588498.1 hypothetical protein [Anaerobacillus isosaccharinicus]QOY38077.1 hypothetical protein AWH56_011370 [Anaerobacillus isosaccharinicus]
MILAIVGVVASFLLLLSIIGFFKEIKTLLWLSIIVLAAYIVYIIGALIWSFTPATVTFYLAAIVVALTIVNIIVIYRI